MAAADSKRARAHEALRQHNRERRAALDPAALDRAARALAARILALPAYREAGRIAAYLAIRGEIDLGPVIDDALARGKQIYVPIVRGERMRFAAFDPDQPLRAAAFGLREPDVADADTIAPTEVDLVLAPLTVFDAECNRIGQGGGYYDRALAERGARPLLVGVAHDFQRTDRIEPNPWDVRLDFVATDAALYRAPR